MERTTGGRLDGTGFDNLFAKLYPQADTFVVPLKTQGAYRRGTVLSLESDGTYTALGAGSGTASCVLCDDTLAADTIAVAYRSGHFNRKALLFAEGYELTAADENDLRAAGIFLSDMDYMPEAREDEDNSAGGAGSGSSGGSGSGSTDDGDGEGG